jgi:hypothetical protein
MQVALNLGLLLILGETHHIVLSWHELLSPCQVKSKQRAAFLITAVGIFDRLCPTEDVFDLFQFESTTTFCELEARSPSESFWKNFQMTPPAARRGTMGNFCTVLYNVARHF